MPINASQRVTKQAMCSKEIWLELMQLHAVYKEKPTKEFVGRKR
jgi:hypothetical protein